MYINKCFEGPGRHIAGRLAKSGEGTWPDLVRLSQIMLGYIQKKILESNLFSSMDATLMCVIKMLDGRIVIKSA